jgi:uncharacterized protein YigA (DUF484 family)
VSGFDPNATLGWQAFRQQVLDNAEAIRGDEELLDALGLRVAPDPNVVDFGQAALSRLEAARHREMTARQEVEEVAKANFKAQSQTHALIVELLESRNNADLARRLDEAAQERFGVAAGVVAVEGPAPAGWRALPAGLIEHLLGAQGLVRMGPCAAIEPLFGEAAGDVRSAALVRMALWTPLRHGLLAFGSSDPEGFTPEMGAELVALLARVIERTAERWPPVL